MHGHSGRRSARGAPCPEGARRGDDVGEAQAAGLCEPTVEGDADTETDAHEAFDVVLARLQLELPNRGGVLELCERRPGGFAVKRKKKIEGSK